MTSPQGIGSTLPEPPFPAELLAAYDAQALPAAVAAHIGARLTDDPRGQHILDALKATRMRLAAAGPEIWALPPHVDERLRALLHGLGNTRP